MAVEFTIAGVVDLFPSLYPEEGPFFVGNLEYVFEQMGGLFPYDVWLALEEGADPEAVVQGVRNLGVPVLTYKDTKGIIAREQARPERQGFFGLLSVGFMASMVLTAVGFIIYAVASFQRRLVELGILKAIGFSTAQLVALLGWEQAFLTLAGLAVGVGLGVSSGYLFIPFMQVGIQVPPFIIRIAWGEIGKICLLFAGMPMVTLASVVVMLRRMKVYEAIKLEAE